MKDTKKKDEIGKIGEKIAVEFLKNKKIKILTTNWYCNHKEIDIIAEDENYLIIVEVKTRSINYAETPLNAISKKKQKFLVEAAQEYIEKYNIDKETRFDVITIILDGQKYELEHIDDAFYPLA